MAEELKKVRKGTKSCTECRRRKVRCTWSSEDAPRCRRCEERGSNCVAQVYSLRTPGSRRLTSKDRIARLEHQVSTLSKALSSDSPPDEFSRFQLIDSRDIAADGDSDSEGSAYGSHESDVEGFGQDPPTHLQTLFENDLISLDTTKPDAHELHRKDVLQKLSIGVRRKLQELIPPKEDVDIIAMFATQWLGLFHALFPAPSMIKTGDELKEQYEAVKTSTIHPAFLASWLLTIAMTIHQVPKGQLGPENQLKGFRNAGQFSRTVSDVVEETFMKHDALLGTPQGIDTAMLFLRLQLTRGNFKKTWLQMRRVIAVAELIGLHRAARRADPAHVDTAEEGNFWSVDIEHSASKKAQVWESLCSIDRIAGMMFNLPPGTRRYRMPQYTHILSNGRISLRAYLCSLSEIAMKVQDFDDLELPEQPDSELYATVLKIDGELRVLANVAPASWWSSSSHLGDQLLQYWHFYITLRAHLPFTLRHDTSEQFSFSRLTCMKACQSLGSLYIVMRGTMPTGFFVCRVLDLQAFTALVVLTLAYHAATPSEKANLHAQSSQPPDVLIPEVLAYMKSIANEPAADFARQAVSAVSSLRRLLDGADMNEPAEDLKLKVPLLGKLHVRRKQQVRVPTSHPPRYPAYNPRMNLARTNSSGQSVTDSSSGLTNGDTPINVSPEDYSWDPLSWFLEDEQAGVFQDTIMMEDFSPFGSYWDQNGTEIEL